MKAEHWKNEDEDEHAIVPGGATRKDRQLLKESTPVYCCTIEGETWEDCLRTFHRHMGWEEYQPMPEDEEPVS